jgi:hypothetical protein
MLTKVDCSAAPTAVLNIAAGKKTWKMNVADRKHIVVIGADSFSCEWTNQKVSVNFRATAENEGSVLSVEIQ